MDIDAYISSGILENYCLGFCSAEEAAEVEKNAVAYPAIKKEIERIRVSLEDFILAQEIKPSPAVKIGVMLSVYKQLVKTDPGYAPFIDGYLDLDILNSWIAGKAISNPGEDFENLYITELPSTDHVTNFIVHAKTGHETEMHDKFIEYLYVIRGSCTMDFGGVKKDFKQGDIIRIDPHINHSATVTSVQPMIALVQRQACA